MSKKNIINFQSVDSIQLYLNSGNADTYINGSKKSSVAPPPHPAPAPPHSTDTVTERERKRCHSRARERERRNYY